MIENFLELVDISEIVQSEEYVNMVDIEVEEDESFILSNGIVSHNSASGSFAKYRDPQYQGALSLRGKFINAQKANMDKLANNDEVIRIIGALGLKVGKPAENLRYGKIYFYCDQDVDGYSIVGQLINFFYHFWPELFEQKRIYKVETPIVIAKKGKTINKFYRDEDYKKWSSRVDNKSWNISYKKGLGALTDSEYRDIIENPYLVLLENDKYSKDNLDTWFLDGSEYSDKRKNNLLK